MSKPLRDYGSSPLDATRRTLSLQLRAVLFDEGLVDSPELPLRPIPAALVANDPDASPAPLPETPTAQKEAA